MLLSGALTWLLTTYASCAVAADVVAEDGCEANETYVSRLRSLDAALVSNACSSLLQEPGTRPITKTVTNTRTVVVATTTDLTVKTRTVGSGRLIPMLLLIRMRKLTSAA